MSYYVSELVHLWFWALLYLSGICMIAGLVLAKGSQPGKKPGKVGSRVVGKKSTSPRALLVATVRLRRLRLGHSRLIDFLCSLYSCISDGYIVFIP